MIPDSRGGGLLYSVRDAPLLLMPVIAALASGRLPLELPPLGRRETEPATEVSPADRKG